MKYYKVKIYSPFCGVYEQYKIDEIGEDEANLFEMHTINK